MYIKRHLEEQVLKASKDYPVVLVCGQRQVGKSTMLYHIKEANRQYISLDNADARRLAEQDPAFFLENYAPPILIDEIQRVPGLFLEIKRYVDERILRGEDVSGAFWLTGSQKFHLMLGVADSLAGRIAVFEMTGFSQAELEGRKAAAFTPEISSIKKRVAECTTKTTATIYEAIFCGSMPKLLTTDIERERYYADYVDTYLERDIKALTQVGKLTAFYEFLVYMAARTAQELHYEAISRAVGVSAPTIKTWVSILERSGIIYILRPYYNNISNRMVKTPKFYFMDTGLAAYLCRWPNAIVLANGAMDGAFLETFVVTEIIKSYYGMGKQPNLYYYRDTDGKEIDLLFVEGDSICPLEVKKAKTPEHSDKNFSVLNKFKLKVLPGLVMCLTDRITPYNRNTWLVPVSVL